MTTLAEHLWRTVAQNGVRTVFGLPGTTNLAALDALRRQPGLRFVTCRHEQAAGHMADASARMFAPFGVALVDLGPGLANVTTAILAAARDSSPVLFIAGNEERALIGREVWHEMPETATFSALAKAAIRIESGESFPRLLREALQLAVSGRPGPVLVSVPKDLWEAPCDAHSPLHVRPPRPHPDPAMIAEVHAILRKAARPICVLGGGARRARSDKPLRDAVERLGLPVVTSPNGRGVLPEDHELCLGHAGRFGNAQASLALKHADVVLAVGCRLDDLTTHSWSLLSPAQRVIHVDIDGSLLQRNWPAEITIQADAAAFFTEIARTAGAFGPPTWSVADRVAERRKARAAFFAIDDDRLLKPQAVIGALERHVPPDHTLVMGGGRFQQFVGEWLVRSPLHFFYAANSGAMGFALPAAIAVALEHPERTVVCALGDGDFMMCVQELETAVREGVRLKCVILNDFAFGAMLERQKVPFATRFSNPPFDELARCFGGAGRKLEIGADVESAVRWLLIQDGLAVLDARIDANERRSLMYGHDIGERGSGVEEMPR